MLKHRRKFMVATTVIIFIALIATILTPLTASASTHPAPQGVTAEHRKVNETAIRWSAPATAASVAEYVVSLRVEATGLTQYKGLPASARVAYFGGIPAGSQYEVSVKARYQSGDSAYVGGGVLKSSSAPRPVTAPAVRAEGSDKLTASWSQPASDEPVNSYTVTVTDGAGKVAAVGTSAGRTFTSAALPVGATFKVRVQARSAVGVSWISDPGRPVAISAPPAGFQPGHIISDQNFFHAAAMTTAEVQSFLNSKVSTCRATAGRPGCLKDFRQDTRDIAAAAAGTCTAVTGRTAQTAAQIITTVATACGISPRTLLVLIQKEQSLVTSTNPSDWAYSYATGWGCPDTAECQKTHTGLFNQLYRAAWQLKAYGVGTFFNWYPVGKVSNIRFHPDAACGSTPVLIQNRATAALYYYTPYQPNAASLSAGYGTGDICSSYGNRNFHNLYRDWFGSPV